VLPNLPEPYASDPEGWWFVPPPYSPKSVAPGERVIEGRAAFETLFGNGYAYDRVAPDEGRRLLLLAAATADAAAAQSTHAPGYRTRLKRRAENLARDLMEHDQEHDTGQGSHPATDPCWSGGRETWRDYVRQQWSQITADAPQAPPASPPDAVAS
jgi:hypothetical protein